jgi:hypothetical protein
MEQITEEMNIQSDWYKEAKNITAEALPTFIKHLTEDYGHDYGTICHALAAAAIAGVYAIENSPTGGITGFQAGAVMWEFILHWMYESSKDNPRRLLDYEKMLYPQYAHEFTQISKETWNWLQERAQKQLNEHEAMCPAVKEHMERIVSGTVPFGFTLEE